MKKWESNVVQRFEELVETVEIVEGNESGTGVKMWECVEKLHEARKS